jgi:molecular chaperone HtpG
MSVSARRHRPYGDADSGSVVATITARDSALNCGAAMRTAAPKFRARHEVTHSGASMRHHECMAQEYRTSAEHLAAEALVLPPFRGVQLLRIKDHIADALALIGREGIFDEYTRHDISHVDGMLQLLDELVPDMARDKMSKADWLLLVLAVYFHDLGMLVTRDEFERRDRQEIANFAEQELFANANGSDYRAKVDALDADKRERFLYQEYIRANHALRIRAWISGEDLPYLGPASEAAREVCELVQNFPVALRDDLAVVCESHHRDDLDDHDKYPTSRPYGGGQQETANVQYAALMLRSADLLHITDERAPSTQYRLISPVDPVSQDEWVKQASVTAVRSQPAMNDDGAVDRDAPRDTIEVFADFPDDRGFFGLTSYLRYADSQINQNFDWAEASRRRYGSEHLYPWKRVDDNRVRAHGYQPQTFEFTIDQGRVLNLLTGHTLYNDTSVVLRELIQNSLDAIRLVFWSDDARKGRIAVKWDSHTRTLTVQDNGTGMTEQIIRDHLLRVGSSRYQDDSFRKDHPDFSPISRFGIGVLSCFMIADSVQITTSHPDEDQARRLTLRDVHGRYLLKLLDKRADDRAASLGPHGTLFELVLRPSASLEDVLETVKRWIVVPGCTVGVTVDEHPEVLVGFESTTEALESVLREHGIVVDGRRVKIDEHTSNDLSLAVALRWSEWFHEWEFIRGTHRMAAPRDRHLALGTCVEGIRVEFGSPGYQEPNVYAIANARGPNAPRTNVARSGLETTGEQQASLRAIYSAYFDHVRRELDELIDTRNYSLTWAAREAAWLSTPLIEARAVNPSLLFKVGAELSLLLADSGEERKLTSPAEVSNLEHFWTMDAGVLRSADALLREIPGSVSLAKLEQVFGPGAFVLPPGTVVSGLFPETALVRSALEGRDVTEVRVVETLRRVDLKWQRVDHPKWWRLAQGRRDPRVWDEILAAFMGQPEASPRDIAIAIDDGIEISPAGTYTGFRAFETWYLLTGDIVAFSRAVRNDLLGATWDDTRLESVRVVLFASLSAALEYRGADLGEHVDDIVRRASAVSSTDVAASMEPYGGIGQMKASLVSAEWNLFDPLAWTRRER